MNMKMFNLIETKETNYNYIMMDKYLFSSML